MSDFIDTTQGILESVPGSTNFLFLAAYGISELIDMIKYEKCKIYVRNNHDHLINVVLNLPKEKKISGWYNIDAFNTDFIYETERKTYEVGIYAECSICNYQWGINGGTDECYIPSNGNAFTIDKNYYNSYIDEYINDGKKIKFYFAKNLQKIEKYTFTLQ